MKQVFLPFAVLATLALAGCDNPNPPPVVNVTTPPTQTVAQAPTVVPVPVPVPEEHHDRVVEVQKDVVHHDGDRTTTVERRDTVEEKKRD
jgi:hypothetical protein